MNDVWMKIQGDVNRNYQKDANTIIPLYPGIKLCYMTFSATSFSIPHKALAHMFQINYCKSGQIVLKMKNGNHIYLNPGDSFLHTWNACMDYVITFPSGMCKGLTIYIDLQETSGNPPELLKDNNIFKTLLSESDSPVFLAGNEQTESIFSAFYGQPKALKLPYQKIKVLELLLYLSKKNFTSQNQLIEFQPELINSIRTIHDQLLHHMEQRITIDELAKQYLINPTTLKNAFKSVYGTSLATHIKEHRMEQAAKMLKETNKTIAEIAQAVGYESQSKFTVAFKTYFNVLPRQYRKKKFEDIPELGDEKSIR